MKSILEAVNILLSDRSSPFVCLIAVDSRVAVKSIEEGIGAALQNTSVSGHEYLKKIINLPFCLPKVKIRNVLEVLLVLVGRKSTKIHPIFER